MVGRYIDSDKIKVAALSFDDEALSWFSEIEDLGAITLESIKADGLLTI